MTTKLNKEQLEDQVKRVKNELERLKYHVREGGWCFIFLVCCIVAVPLAVWYRFENTAINGLSVTALVLIPLLLIPFLNHIIKAFLRSKEKTWMDDRNEEEEILKQQEQQQKKP